MENKETIMSVQVDADSMEQAQQVLDRLGISLSNAISMFLHQIAIQQKIPIEVSIPESCRSLNHDELIQALRKGLNDVEEGKIISEDELEKRMNSIIE